MTYAFVSLRLLCLAPLTGCHERGPLVTKDEATGGSGNGSSSCKCQPLEGSSDLTVLTERDCYCENIGACPSSIDAAKSPGTFVRVVEYQCNNGQILISRSNEIEVRGYIFDSETERLIGAYVSIDYVSSCGLTTLFGTQVNDKSACDYCITSHGTKFIAHEGECLLPEELPDDFATGPGGAGGEPSAR